MTRFLLICAFHGDGLRPECRHRSHRKSDDHPIKFERKLPLHLRPMQAATPSRTALRVALRRAAHQLYDAPPLVLNDPIAVPILGTAYSEELRRTPTRPDRPFSVSLRAFLVARSRFAEDALARAVKQGATQYVLLGAGLDTFAHRNPYPHLRVFEVDHPATQQWKRELLEAGSLPAPGNLTYVPVDFERDSLSQQLHSAGFDSKAPAFFAWLGVVPYLNLEAFRSTINFIAAQRPGSGLRARPTGRRTFSTLLQSARNGCRTNRLPRPRRSRFR
jgi:methyltransferase (TIGR00027 family)